MIDFEKLKQTQTEIASRKGAGGDFWKATEGRHKVRILPPWGNPPGRDFYFEIYSHWVPAAKRSTLCLQKQNPPSPCFACEKATEKTTAKKAAPRYLINVLVLTTMEETAKGVQTWIVSATLLGDILFEFQDDDGNFVRDITDPNTGYDLIVERMGKDQNTKYNIRAAREASALSVHVQDPAALLAKLPDLPAIITPDGYQDQMLLFAGDAGSDPPPIVQPGIQPVGQPLAPPPLAPPIAAPPPIVYPQTAILGANNVPYCPMHVNGVSDSQCPACVSVFQVTSQVPVAAPVAPIAPVAVEPTTPIVEPQPAAPIAPIAPVAPTAPVVEETAIPAATAPLVPPPAPVAPASVAPEPVVPPPAPPKATKKK